LRKIVFCAVNVSCATKRCLVLTMLFISFVPVVTRTVLQLPMITIMTMVPRLATLRRCRHRLVWRSAWTLTRCGTARPRFSSFGWRRCPPRPPPPPPLVVRREKAAADVVRRPIQPFEPATFHSCCGRTFFLLFKRKKIYKNHTLDEMAVCTLCLQLARPRYIVHVRSDQE
jgi:hypothetical protein